MQLSHRNETSGQTVSSTTYFGLFLSMWPSRAFPLRTARFLPHVSPSRLTRENPCDWMGWFSVIEILASKPLGFRSRPLASADASDAVDACGIVPITFFGGRVFRWCFLIGLMVGPAVLKSQVPGELHHFVTLATVFQFGSIATF